MKVQVHGTETTYFENIGTGCTFRFNGECYLKTTLLSNDMFYAVRLSDGLCTSFYDVTSVQPIKLMVVPEE